MLHTGGSRFYLLFAVLCHEALVADVGEEEAFGDGDVGGVLVGGVGGAFIGIHSRHTWASPPFFL